MSSSINLFVPYFRKQEVLAEIESCLDRGWTGMGFKTVEFEELWGQATGLPHGHFVNSATAALHLALEVSKRVQGWQALDEVITTPLTFVSTNHVILQAGLRPVFADVDEYLCLDPESVAARITPRTRAVMFVGLGGNAGRLSEIAELCRERGLRLILDAAHMAGTRVGGRDAGHLADVTCYSFQAVKNLPTADSGMVCFNETAEDTLARQLSWLGINKDTFTRASSGSYSWDYDVDDVGYKYNGNSIMAAMAIVSLRYLEADNTIRRTLAALYESLLQPLLGSIDIVPTAPDCVSSRHLFQVRVRNREELIKHLQQAEIFPGVHYKTNTEYRMYREWSNACPNATRASSELLSLPLHVQMSELDVARVVSVLADWGV